MSFLQAGCMKRCVRKPDDRKEIKIWRKRRRQRKVRIFHILI